MKFIPVTNSTKLAIVDDEDYKRVNNWNWYITSYTKANKGRIVSGINGLIIPLAQFVLGRPPEGKDLIDHIDRDPFNNQKSNLRFATRSQNQANRLHVTGNSGYRGVWFRKDSNNWRASICVNGKTHGLGSFASREEAAEAYNLAAMKYFGEFAILNEIETKKDA